MAHLRDASDCTAESQAWFTDGIIGVRFSADDGTHYGFVEIEFIPYTDRQSVQGAVDACPLGLPGGARPAAHDPALSGSSASIFRATPTGPVRPSPPRRAPRFSRRDLLPDFFAPPSNPGSGTCPPSLVHPRCPEVAFRTPLA